MYNGFKNYATWSVYNYISNNEESYNKYYSLCEKISKAGIAGNEALYQVKNALEDDFKKPGIIDINESERAGLYADILDDALSEIDFYDVARAFYGPFAAFGER